MAVRIRVTSALPRLERDMRRIADEAPERMDAATRRVATHGNALAKASAERQSGVHGKNYPQAFTVERKGLADYEYGPDANDPGGQGGMNFEYGPGPQSSPHLNVTKSHDVVKVEFPKAGGDVIDGLFW